MFKDKSNLLILLTVALILTIPLAGTVFSDNVDWKIGDFILAAFILLGVGFVCKFIIKKVKKVYQRILICGGIIVLALLLWAEIAVGIFAV